MVLIRFILWSIIFYFVFKMIKIISNSLRLNKINEPRNEAEYHQETKIKINEKDIIEAEFEDLTPPNKN